VNDILLVKKIEIRDPFAGKAEGVVELVQRLTAIGLKIPEGVVKVEEKVFILHDYRKYALANMAYFRQSAENCPSEDARAF
jgi:hypothetical protein